MSEPNPIISVIIPMYNGEATVRRALESVFAQTFAEFEVIVVDDGSTDGGASVATATGDPRVRVVRQDNAGVSAARNRGIREARSNWIAFLDCDDEWKPAYLETIQMLRTWNSDCAVAATSYEYRHADDTVTLPILKGFDPSGGVGVLNPYFKIAAQSSPPLWTSAVTASRAALEAVGGFPEGVTSGEDVFTWAKLAREHSIAYCVEPLAVYRVQLLEDGRYKRTLPERDRVGEDLVRLMTKPPRPAGWRRYLARWYKARAWQWMNQGRRGQLLRNAGRSLWYYPFHVKVYGYVAMAFVPRGVHRKAAEIFDALHRRLRPGRSRI